MHPFTIEKIIANNNKPVGCRAIMPADGNTPINHDALLNILAKFIRNHPITVINLLKQYKFHINEQPTTQEIVKTTSAAISRSKKFTTALVKAIQQSEGVKISSADGYSACANQPSTGNDIVGILQGGAALTNALGGIFGGKNRAASTPASTNTANTQQAEAEAALLAKASSKGKSNTGLFIGLTIGIIAIAGFALAIVKMSHKSAAPAAAPAA